MNNIEVIKAIPKLHVLKKVCGYARVSTEDEHQDSSFRMQMDELENIIKSNSSYTFIGIFKDKKSGTSTRHRSEFNLMIDLARAGEINVIYTKSITRFARNILDTINIVRELKLINVEVIFQKENISSLDPSMEFVLSVLAMQAEEESKNISENTRWNITRKINNGGNLTSHLYGYRINGESWTIVDSEAKIVRMVFNMYLQGKSYKSIVELLYKMKVKTLKGKPKWHVGTLEQMVQNEKYAGHMALGKTFVHNGTTLKSKRLAYQEKMIMNHHEPIISPSVFDQAMALRLSRTKNTIEQYVPLSKRVTPYYQFVYSVENKHYLRYVVERPKGKYEIPTLFCYDGDNKNRIMITVNNLFLLLNDALSKVKSLGFSLSSEAKTLIDDALLECDKSLAEDDSNAIKILEHKTRLISTKKSLSSYIRILNLFKSYSTIDQFKNLISKVIIVNSNTIVVKLSLIDSLLGDHELLNSSIPLKIKSVISDISYTVVF